MSVKTKLIIAAAAVLGVSSAYAGGPEMMAAPAAPSFTPFFYAEAGLGYAQTGYDDFYNVEGALSDLAIAAGAFSGINLSDVDNKNGGMTYLGNFGYQFMPHLAFELGGGFLPEYKSTVSLEYDSSLSTKAKIESWYAYGAARMNTNIINDKTSLYGKAGLAYRSMKFKIDPVNEIGVDESESFFAPIFGAGVSYSVRDNIYVAAEYDHIGGTNDLKTYTIDGLGSDLYVSAPDVNIFTGKLGYKFSF